MNKLPITRHPIIRILKLVQPHTSPSSKLPTKFKYLIQSLDFRVFTEEELKNIYEMLINNETITNINKTYNFCAPLLDDTINSIIGLDFNELTEEDTACVAFFVLHSVNSWLMFSENNRSQTSFLQIMVCLNILPQNDLIDDTFFFISECALRSKIDFSFASFITNVFDFFEKRKAFNEDYLLYMVKWVNILPAEKNGELSQEASDILFFIAKIYDENPHLFHKDLPLIADELHNRVANLDPVVLKFYCLITTRLDENHYTAVFANVPLYLETLIKSMPPCQLAMNGEEIIPIEIPQVHPFLYHFTDSITFEKGTTLSLSSFTFEKQKIVSFLPKPIFIRNDILMNLFMMCPNAFAQIVEVYINVLKENTHEQNFIYIAICFLSNLEAIKWEKYIDEIIVVFFNSPIFNPSICIHNGKEEYIPVLIVREQIYSLLFDHLFDCFEDVLNTFIEYPLIIAEIFTHLTHNLQKVNFDYLKSQEFLRLFNYISSIYQSIDFAKSENKNEIEIARVSLLVFMSTVLQIDEINSVWFNSDFFMSMFLSYLFEISLRHFVLVNIQNMWMKGRIDIRYFISIIETCKHSMEDKRTLELLTDLIRTICFVIENQQLENQPFKPIHETICSTLKNFVPKDETSRIFLNQIIDYLIDVSDSLMLDPSALDALASSIIGDQEMYTPNLQNKLIKLIAGNSPITIPNQIMIKQIYVLPILVNIYLNKSNIVEILEFIESLVIYSSENGISCHRSKFDILLLDLINKKKMDEDDEFIEPAIRLISKIASVESSTPVVLRFIALFAPDKERKISKKHLFFIQSMTDIIRSKNRIPQSYIPMAENSPQVNIKGINGSHLNKGFTFVCWLLFDHNAMKSQPTIFKMLDYKNCGFIGSIFDSSLIITIYNVTHSENFKIPIEIPFDKWNLITFTVSHQGNEIYVTGTINVNQGEIIEGDPYDIDSGSLTFTVGDTEVVSSSLIGPFGLFGPLNDDKIQEIYICGPRTTPSINSMVFITPHVENGMLAISNENTKIYYSAELMGEPNFQTISFTEVLILYCKIHLLIPLFAHLDLNPENTNAETVLLLFRSVLLISEEGQKSFFQADGFTIISHLLQMIDPIHLTYSLYTIFMSLFDEISFDGLKTQLFDKILFNFELWVRTDNDTQLRISRHWSQVLFASNYELVERFRSYAHILAALRIYYYYSACEQYVHEDRASNIQVDNIRKNIIRLLYQEMSYEFKPRDCGLLIGACISCNDSKQVCDLLIVIQNISAQQDSPIKGMHAFLALDSLLELCDEEITFRLFDTISILHENEIITRLSLDEHIVNIIDAIPVKIYSHEFVERLVNKTNECFYLLPICFIASIYSGHGNIISENLKSNDKFAIIKFWYIWPILSGLKNQGEFLEFVMMFIVKHNNTDDFWINIYLMIEILSRITNTNADEAKYLLLLEFSKYLILIPDEEFDENKLLQFYDLTEYYLFFKETNLLNKSLENLYQNSIFYSDEQRTKIPNLFEDGFSYSSFYKLIDQYKTPKIPIFHFGLRFNENGKWIDMKLALNCLELSKRTNNTQCINFSAFLCYFTMRNNKEAAYQYFDLLLNNNIVTVPFKIFLSQLSNTAIETIENHEECFNQIIYSCSMIKDRMFSHSITQVNNYLKGLTHFIFDKGYLIKSNSLRSLKKYQKKFSDDRMEKLKAWQHLWAQLTFELSPWQSTSYEKHWKRDDSYCWNFCPMKLKLNKNFDDHRLASFSRDSGSQTTAQLLHEKYKEEKEAEYKNQPQYELLKIVTEQSKKKQVISEEKCRLDIVALLMKTSSQKEIRFQQYSNMIMLVKQNKESKIINASNIKVIFQRNILAHPTGIEIFTKDRNAYLIHFPAIYNKTIIDFICSIQQFSNVDIQVNPHNVYFQMSGLTNQWINRTISNFEYLMQLNIYSGRTFNDPSMYPVFPWIISDYEKEELDFRDETIFRDLSKPVGSLDDERLNTLRERSLELKEIGYDSYLYANGYISPLVVYNYLIRIEPFTSSHIDLQSGRFDHAKRLFYSIKNTYRMVAHHVNDYRELIPEFFFLPDFLINSNNFDLGMSGETVLNDVELPSWAHSAIEFIYLHRKALESDYVSQHLDEWIDLIWGCRQDHDAINSFNPMMFQTVWNDPQNLKNPTRRAEIEGVLQYSGQIPIKLFDSAHPKRRNFVPKSMINSPIIILSQSKNIKYAYMEGRIENSFVAIICDEKGFFLRSKFSLDDNNVEERIIKGFSCKKDDILAVYNQNLAIVSDDSLKIQIQEMKKSYQVVNHVGKINCIAADSNLIATGGSDTITNIYSTEDPIRLLYNIQSFRDEIVSVAVNSTFNVVVSGTRDGSIFIISISKGIITKTIDIEGRYPNDIIITKSWGFIVIFETELVAGQIYNFIEVYTINGDFIRKKQVSFSILCWMTYISSDGFDYLLVSDQKGKIIGFEAFYINVKTIFRCQTSITLIWYSKDYKIVSAVAKDGTVFFIPY